MLKKTLLSTAALVAALSFSLASCSAADYKTLGPGEYQIAGHEFKTAVDCEREAPIGKFDRKCDIPVVGIRGWSPDASIGISAGGNASGPTM